MLRLPFVSKVLCETQRIVDRRMGVARRNRVADAEQPIGSGRIALDGLGSARKQGVIGYFAEVLRARLEFEIEIIQRDRAVIDDDLVHGSRFRHAAIIAADVGDGRCGR